ncbi:hypothetical protein [Vibrio phage vB_pir03]|nr:hypothetical protein [Vibrio phage vB_pir03]
MERGYPLSCSTSFFFFKFKITDHSNRLVFQKGEPSGRGF